MRRGDISVWIGDVETDAEGKDPRGDSWAHLTVLGSWAMMGNAAAVRAT